MFARLEKPFLTVETGEAYQPIRLTYDVLDAAKLTSTLSHLKCLHKNTVPQSWTWYWRDECADLHFESVSAFRRDSTPAVRLGTLVLKDKKLYLNLPSFKRACMAISFFYHAIDAKQAQVVCADFINKVFAIDEQLPHGFSELLKEEELNRVLQERVHDYETIKEKCEHAASPEEAFQILADYSKQEAQKRLPYVERYSFDLQKSEDPEIIFLAFYVFMRGREMVAIKRWLGDAHYTLSDAADDIVEQVFGGLGVDIIE